MRNLFINLLEKLIVVIVVLLGIAVVVAAVMAMFSGQSGGFFIGLGILVGGGIYVILIGGMLFLGVGIYDNTKRTAAAVERMSQGGGST